MDFTKSSKTCLFFFHSQEAGGRTEGCCGWKGSENEDCCRDHCRAERKERKEGKKLCASEVMAGVGRVGWLMQKWVFTIPLLFYTLKKKANV